MAAEKAERFTVRGAERMIALTFPIFKSRFGPNRTLIFILVALSVALGFVPTIKSQLESGVLQEINDALRSRREQARRPDVNDIVNKRLLRFSEPGDQEKANLPELLTSWMFRDIKLGIALLVYLVIALVALALDVFARSVQTRIEKDLFAHLRGEGMRRALLTDPSDLPSFQNIAGQYSNAIQQGASAVSNTYGYMLEAGQYIFALGTTLILVATKSWIFALSALMLIAGQAGISVLQARRLSKKRNELDRLRNHLVGRTDDILSKREILVAYEQQEKYAGKMDAITTEYAQIERTLEISEQKYRGFSDLLTDYAKMLILFIALVLTVYVNQSAVGDIGDAYFLISIYVRMFVPATNLLFRYDAVRRSEATSKTFLDVLQSGDHVGHTGPSAEWKGHSEIQFTNVSFRYDPIKDDRDVLHDCTFTIPAEKTTLILGPSGSGKTTIAKLLLRFWPLRSGSIKVGGQDITKLSGHEVRAHMSYVSQGDHIIEDTVRENLSWGYSAGEITAEIMRSVLAAVGLTAPPGYEDLLDVPARELSGGQQQRLSIARMMLDESEIVIMDEPLAGVDVFTGSERESVKPLILGRILQNHEFGPAGRHVLGL